MSSIAKSAVLFASNPATPHAVAALRARPGFEQAIRTSAAGLIAMYQGGHLLNWLMDDRGRLLFAYFALYFDASRDSADPSSGLTPTRMRTLVAEYDICSPGRATAMLSLMRFGGYLAPDIQVADRRQRPLVATDKLNNLLRERWRVHFNAMAPLLPDGDALLAVLDDAAVRRALVVGMVERFRAGFRFISHMPELGLFGERNAGLFILMTLITAGEENDSVPPSRPVPISMAALARRFRVSRPHVLKLIRDAADGGFIERVGQDGSRIVIRPRLAEATQIFFATMYLFFADSAREAMRVVERRSKAG
jgi:DNA-binding MarR family transcriptional regulator